MRVINQANRFNKLPSEIARIHNEYEAFCFDEACDYIIRQLEDKKTPRWREERQSKDNVRAKTLQLAEKLRNERR